MLKYFHPFCLLTTKEKEILPVDVFTLFVFAR